MSYSTDSAGWKIGRVGDLPIAIIDGDRSGKYPKRSEFQTSGHLFLNTTNIIEDRLDLSGANYISEEKYAQITKGRLERLDIVMTTRGSIGKVALFNLPMHGLINAQMLILRADGVTLDHAFVFHLVRSDDFQRTLRNFSSGSAQPQIPITDLRSIEIRYPRISIQRKIASILSAYDHLIENNTRQIKILEEMAQMIYREWFVNFRFPGYQKVKMVDSVLGSIPAGWEVKTLDQIMDFQGGSQPPKSEWIEEPHAGFVRMIQIRDYQSDSYKCYVRDSKVLRKCVENDIMIARYGASVARICWGLGGAYNVALVRVVPVSLHFKEFLRSYLQSGTFQALLIGMSGRTAQAGFNKSNLTSIQLAIPKDPGLLVAYEEVSAPLRQLTLTLRKVAKIASDTRDFLLPKLISGEITVDDLETEAIAQGV